MTRRPSLSLALSLVLLASCNASGSPTSTLPAVTSTSLSSTTTSAPAQQSVDVFFGVDGSSDCAEVQPFRRQIPSGTNPIEGAFAALLAGPSPTEATAVSWFSEQTADALRSVEMDDGTLTVDLADLSSVISGASSSCGSAALLAQLQATGFQFPEVERINFQFEGSCEAFFGFLQMECTVVEDRS